MKHLMVTTIIAILVGAHCCIAGEISERMKQIVDSCFAKARVTQEDKQKLIDANFVLDEGDPSIMCFANCVMDEWGVMKDGALDEEAVMTMFTPIFGTEKLTEIVEECKNEQGEAPCETEFKIFTCFNRLAGTGV